MGSRVVTGLLPGCRLTGLALGADVDGVAAREHAQGAVGHHRAQVGVNIHVAAAAHAVQQAEHGAGRNAVAQPDADADRLVVYGIDAEVAGLELRQADLQVVHGVNRRLPVQPRPDGCRAGHDAEAAHPGHLRRLHDVVAASRQGQHGDRGAAKQRQAPEAAWHQGGHRGTKP